MAIINEGGKIRDKIFAAQAKFGLEFPNYLATLPNFFRQKPEGSKRNNPSIRD